MADQQSSSVDVAVLIPALLDVFAKATYAREKGHSRPIGCSSSLFCRWFAADQVTVLGRDAGEHGRHQGEHRF